MKKCVIFSLLLVNLGFGQDSEIKAELPNIIPPSPTISGLMKFEEIPVSNYSGVPDISIPIFNFKTTSKDVSIGLNLQYHPSSIAFDEVSGDNGLGWSLTTTNTISRTVRGLPDEILLMGGNGYAKIGLYYDSTQNNVNNYYQVEKYLKNENFYGQYYDEFLYDNNIPETLDSEHDLYQFNFFGKSGRFIIKKNDVTDALEIVRLDSDKKIKLELNYTFQNGIYSINSFTAFDEKGIEYFFDVIENTVLSRFNDSTYFDGQTSMSGSSFDFKSAFNLSKVIDINDIEIIKCHYEIFNEIVVNGTVTTYFPNNISPEANELFEHHSNVHWVDFNFKQLGPANVTSASQRTITNPKLSNIEIKNIGNIFFDYESGRLDSNIHNGSVAVKLKGIKIFDNYTNLIKEINFNYMYREHNTLGINVKRMFLKSLIEKNSIDSIENKYNFYYQDNDSSGREISKDSWGYFNLLPILNNGGFYRDVNPNFCTTDVLQKIEYPTGGVRVFNFESNTYSFEGQSELMDFDTNPDNFEEHFAYKNFNSINNNLTTFFSLQNQAREVYFSTQIGFPTNDWWFHIYKDVKSPSTKVFSVFSNSISNSNGYVKAPDLAPGNYLVEFTINDIPTGYVTYNSTINVSYKVKVNSTNYKNYLYGGGIRIKNILSFQNLLSSNSFGSQPIEQTDFIYALESNTTKSSGSLVFPKPQFDYTTYKRLHLKSGDVEDEYNFLIDDTFSVRTTANNLSHIRTQGSDVGYKNVKVIKKGENNIRGPILTLNSDNGYIKYVYSSPIDYPEELEYNNLNYPFLPTSNFDYKRGLLLKQSVYNESGTILKEISNVYDFIDESEYVTGIKTYSFNNCPFVYLYPTFFNYNSRLQYCLLNSNCNYPQIGSMFNNDLSNFTCMYVSNFVQASLLYSAIGKALLKSTKAKEYFYDNNLIQELVIDQNFSYSIYNNEILSSGVVYSPGESREIKYYYAHEMNNQAMIAKNMVGIPLKTEVKKNNELLSTQETTYKDWGNGFLAPEFIKTSKGSNPLETRVIYNSVDPSNGNPLEVQLESGMHICYIWGYNKTQPIAKIENATYIQVQQYVANLQTLSNGTNESSLITALNDLRTALPNAMVTTYTYKPLVGISTVTDPKGNKQTYHYDGFGRLQYVKDAQGNILSENQYHYKTQN